MENKQMLIYLANMIGSENFIKHLEKNIDNMDDNETQELSLNLIYVLQCDGLVEWSCRASKEKPGLFYFELLEKK